MRVTTEVFLGLQDPSRDSNNREKYQDQCKVYEWFTVNKIKFTWFYWPLVEIFILVTVTSSLTN